MAWSGKKGGGGACVPNFGLQTVRSIIFLPRESFLMWVGRLGVATPMTRGGGGSFGNGLVFVAVPLRLLRLLTVAAWQGRGSVG